MVQQTLDGIELPAKQDALSIIERVIEKAACDPNFDPGKLATLLDVQLRYKAAQSKEQFDRAMELFRANKTVVEKTKHVVIPVKDGGKPIEYWHAELDKAAEIVSDALAAVGLSYTWEMDATADGKPKMSLIMRGFGHTERIGGMVGPPDLSGTKNAMQAIGSSATYLARYTLLLSVGIVPKNQDDDGRAATGGLAEQAILEYCTAIQDAHGFEDSKKAFGEAWNAAGNCSDEPAQMRFLKVFNEKKKKLAAEKRNG